MKILAIETSADETAAAVVDGRRILSNAVYSQILIHKKWGGIFPTLAKRAHEEKIDLIVSEALKKYPIKTIDCIAVTQGPGLAISLEVGIKKAKELSKKYGKRLIGVNHLEGHIYSSFVQNSKGKPSRNFDFPYLALIISGGHTELVKFTDHLKYEVIGETIDDAAGEALDKAGKLLGLGYPAGPVLERLAAKVENRDPYKFPRPMVKNPGLDFSFSGLKTAFYYFLKKNPEVSSNIADLASSFQEAVFDTVIKKTEQAMRQTGINRLVVGGGVIANLYLRKKLRQLAKKQSGEVFFPSFKYLTGDNAAMIGVAASFRAKKGLFVKDMNLLDRVPRMRL